MDSRPVAIIQARLTSSRLPGKVMKNLGKVSALELMLGRLRRAQRLSRIVIAIPDSPDNDDLARYVEGLPDVDLLRGPEDDVLTRFRMVADRFPAKFYVRLTADCPFVCPEIVDEVIAAAIASGAWCYGNANPPTFPDGFDVECISRAALEWLDRHAHSSRHREHVTLRLYEDPPAEAVVKNLSNPRGDFSAVRLTLDTPEDLEALKRLSDHVGDERAFHVGAADIEQAYIKLGLDKINGRLVRNAALQSSR
jgi:spore coat polysaccharide biosynthesis protein SpsF (cytidylyltransferase family)